MATLFNMVVVGSHDNASDRELEVPLVAPDPSLYTCDGTVDFQSCPALRARTGRWVACIFIIGYELIERLAYYGIIANLVLYMKNELHEGTATATESFNNWAGATTKPADLWSLSCRCLSGQISNHCLFFYILYPCKWADFANIIVGKFSLQQMYFYSMSKGVDYVDAFNVSYSAQTWFLPRFLFCNDQL